MPRHWDWAGPAGQPRHQGSRISSTRRGSSDDGIRVRRRSYGRDFDGDIGGYGDDEEHGDDDDLARARSNTRRDSFGRNDDYDDGIRVRPRNRRYSYETRHGTYKDGYEHRPRSYSPPFRGRRSSPPRPLGQQPSPPQELQDCIKALERSSSLLHYVLLSKSREQLLLTQRLDEMAQAKEELEKKLKERRETHTYIQSELGLVAADLEQLEKAQKHAADIYKSRLMSLSLDEDNALQQQERSGLGDSATEQQDDQDPSRRNVGGERAAQRLRKIQDEKAELTRGHEQGANSTEIKAQGLRDKITHLEQQVKRFQESEEMKTLEKLAQNYQGYSEDLMDLQQEVEQKQQLLHHISTELEALRQEESAVTEAWPIGDGENLTEDDKEILPPPPPYYIDKHHRARRAREPSTPSTASVDNSGNSDNTYDSSDDSSYFGSDNYRVTYKALEKEGISFSMLLNKGVLAVPAAAQDDPSPLAPESSAWKLARTNLSDGQSSTELFVVHASEYSTDEMGTGRTTLVCPVGPQKQDTETAVQMRWLHVQQPALKFKTLEQLVLSCPYITEALRPIAIEAMEKVKDKFCNISELGASVQAGSILRFVGKYNDSYLDSSKNNETEPVIFLSSPFLTLQTNSSRSASKEEHQSLTLLQSLYGYDVGGERENEQVVQRSGVAKSKKEMLHINQLWCLLIGSSVLITISDKPAAEIKGSTIVTDSRTSGNREPLLIRLTDKKDRQYHVVIERDYNYADFLKYAVTLVAGNCADPSDYELFDQSQQMLRPIQWVQILGSSDSQLHTFSVLKRNDRSRDKMREYNDADWEESEAGNYRSKGVRPLPTFLHHVSRSPDGVRYSNQPDHLSNSKIRSYSPNTRNHRAVARDDYDSRSNRAWEGVESRRGRHIKRPGLNRGEGGPSLESSRRRTTDDPAVSEVPVPPKCAESREAEQDGGDTMRPPTRDTLDETGTATLIPEEKDDSYDVELKDEDRHSPRSLSPIEEESTSPGSRSSISDRSDSGTIEKPSNGRVSDSVQTNFSNSAASPEKMTAPGPKGREALSDPDAEAPVTVPSDPTATASSTKPLAEYAREVERHEGGPSKRTRPDVLFRYVEPRSRSPAVGGSNDTSQRREDYRQGDEDASQQQFGLEEKEARRLEEEASPAQSPHDADALGGSRIYDAKDDKNTSSRGSPFDYPVDRQRPSDARAAGDHDGETSPVLPTYSTTQPERQRDRRARPGYMYLAGARRPISSSGSHQGTRSRPLPPFGKPHGHQSTPNLRTGSSYDTSGGTSALPSQPVTPIVDYQPPGLPTYATSISSIANRPGTSRTADEGPVGQIINSRSASKKLPTPEVYDLEIEEEGKELSDTEASEASGSDSDNGPMNRKAPLPAKGSLNIDISTKKSDLQRPLTTIIFRASGGALVPFKRIVLRRRIQPGNPPLPNITHTEEDVEDTAEPGPFDSYGQRFFYRSEPSPPGDEDSWFDEFVVDTTSWPRPHQEWDVVIEWPLPPERKDEVETDPVIVPLIDSVPFLNWRLKNDKDERTPEEVEKSLVSILSRLNKSLSNGVVARLYSRVFKCTMKDLIQRHDFLLKKPPGDGVTEANKPPNTGDTIRDTPVLASSMGVENNSPGDNAVNHTSNASDTGETQTSESTKRPEEATHPQPIDASETAPTTDSDGRQIGQTQSMEATNHEQELMKRLFGISKEILGAYVPDQGGPLIHHVCVRFWGAVDDIFRQVIWEGASSYFSEELTYTIHNFDAASPTVGKGKSLSFSKRRSWSKCPSCKGSKAYNSAAEALEHLHEHHFDCSGKTERPYDDPCYSWLRYIRNSAYTYQQVPGIGNSGQLEDFISQLLPISGYARELHSLVASTRTNQANPSNTRPPLPAKVVHAFEQIMAMYVIRAQWLSLNNRKDSSAYNREAIDLKIAELMLQEERAKEQVYDDLQDAKKDIILLKGTSRHIDSLGVEAVGAEFLVMAIMVNLQNRSVLVKQTPAGPERADFIEMYQKYTSQLRFQANRRPKKRVFLDIHGLEEELDALHGLVEAQTSLVGKYLRLLAPGSTRTTNATRVGLYKIEREYGRSHQRVLRTKQENIRILREKSEVLKEQVKQTIEILEEDHGKAIRVFTFVTLLFLPLSFVTSFMGMNTKDVRDMEFTQNIFWMTGLPVTLVVITVALIYAYKSEEVEDWMWRQMEGRRRRPGRSSGGDGTRTGPARPEEKTGMIHVDSALAQTSGWDGQGRYGRADGQADSRAMKTWMALRRKRKRHSGRVVTRRAAAGNGL